MNIQDIISTIINYIKNMDKKDLIIFSLVFYTLYKTKTIEKNTDLNETNIREQIKSVYQADVQAIKNLGDLASRMINVEGNMLKLPYDVQIEGELIVDKNINLSKGGSLKSLGKNRRFVLASNDDNFYIQTDLPNIKFTNYGNEGGDKNIIANKISTGEINVSIEKNSDGENITSGDVKIEGRLEVSKDVELNTDASDKGYHFAPTGLWLRNKKLDQVSNINVSGNVESDGVFVRNALVFGDTFENNPNIVKKDDGIETNRIFYAKKLHLEDQNPLYMNIEGEKKQVNSNGDNWKWAIT